MDTPTAAYTLEQLLIMAIGMLLLGIALGAAIAIGAYKALIAPPESLVKEELDAIRSAQRLAAAAGRTRQAMRREQAAAVQQDDYPDYDTDDFDGWEASHAR